MFNKKKAAATKWKTEANLDERIQIRQVSQLFHIW
jgi:hypothetical protein